MILFDLGGVLVDFAGFRELGPLLAEPLGADAIRSRWLHSAPVREFELGRITAREFAARFVAEWRIPLSPAEFLRTFAGWPRGLYPGVESLLGVLRPRHRLACLSNSNELHWRAFGPALAPHFESTFVSFELGLAKPDPAIFRAALTGLGVAADEVLFFDDAEANVAAAAEVGLHAELVRGASALRARLVELQLLGA